MKKKNLLALSALVLSLGLTVSSCAGAQGEKGDTGDKGDTGEQGPQGPEGKPGQDGKTYIPVIVVNDDDIVGGEIGQDKYWVEAGTNDSVTFTFTADDPTNDLVVNFEINGEVVEFSPEQTEFTLTVDDSYGSVQVTGALFTNATGYGESLVAARLKEISDADHLVYKPTSGTVGAADYDAGVNAAYSLATFADDSLYSELEVEAKAAIAKAVSDLGADATASAKLEASRTAANAAIEEINTTYETLVADAKLEAKSMVEDYTDTVTNSAYSDTDRDTIEASAIASIDAATTLEGISKIVNEAECALPNNGKFEEGSYKVLMERKEATLNGLEDTFDNLVADESWLDPESSAANKTEYDNMVETLKLYGVEVTTLPGSVYENYAAQASSATELPLNDKNQIALLVEGNKAINDTYDGVKTQLTAGILASYTEEIDNAKSLASAPNAKTTLKGVVEGVISNFVTEDTDTTPKKIEDYVSPATQVVNHVTVGVGLIGRIEVALAKAVTENGLTAFTEERKTNAVNEAIASLNAQAAEINEKDPLYGAMFGAPVYDENNTLLGFQTVKNPLSWDNTFENPYIKTIGDVTTGNRVTYVKSSAGNIPFNGLDLAGSEDNAGVNEWAPSLYERIVNEYSKTLKDQADIASVKTTLASILVSQNRRYEGTVEDFKNKLWNKYQPTDFTGATYVNKAQVQETWNKSKLETLSDVANAAESLKDSTTALLSLDKAVADFVAKTNTTDSAYKAFFEDTTNNNISTFKDSFDKAVEDVLTGKMNSSDVRRWTTDTNLKALYEADVANYLTVTQNWINQQYQNKISGANITPTQSEVLTRIYNELTSFVGHKVVTDSNSVTGLKIKDNAQSTEAGYQDLTCKTIVSINSLETLARDLIVNFPRQ